MPLMITGHRKIVPVGWVGSPWPDNPNVIKHHEQIVNILASSCYTFSNVTQDSTFITGMAIGADQLFASAVLSLKQRGLLCNLIAAVPFKGQESKWPQKSKNLYYSILECCDMVQYVSEPGYEAWKMQRRNEWMVDRATSVIALWDGSSGGTRSCAEYAKRQGKEIHILNPQSLEFSKW